MLTCALDLPASRLLKLREAKIIFYLILFKCERADCIPPSISSSESARQPGRALQTASGDATAPSQTPEPGDKIVQQLTK